MLLGDASRHPLSGSTKLQEPPAIFLSIGSQGFVVHRHSFRGSICTSGRIFTTASQSPSVYRCQVDVRFVGGKNASLILCDSRTPGTLAKSLRNILLRAWNGGNSGAVDHSTSPNPCPTRLGAGSALPKLSRSSKRMTVKTLETCLVENAPVFVHSCVVCSRLRSLPSHLRRAGSTHSHARPSPGYFHWSRSQTRWRMKMHVSVTQQPVFLQSQDTERH